MSPTRGRLLVADEAGPFLARHGLVDPEAFLAPDLGRLVRRVGIKENRILELEGRRFHLKRFARRGPESGPREYEVALRARDAGVPVVLPLAAGRAARGGGSFVISEDVAGAEPLHTAWPGLSPARRRQAALDLASMTRRLHGARIVHRDLNLWHVLLCPGDTLRLIDLGRALVSPPLFRRWRTKDLGSLTYAAAAAGVPRRFRLRFYAAYTRGDRHRAKRRLLASALRKAARIARHERRRSHERTGQ